MFAEKRSPKKATAQTNASTIAKNVRQVVRKKAPPNLRRSMGIDRKKGPRLTEKRSPKKAIGPTRASEVAKNVTPNSFRPTLQKRD